MTEDWRTFLQSSLQLPAFYEHGLWRALCGAARPALSDLVTHAIVLEAAMKQRQAQDLVVYAMDLEAEIGECSTEAARTRFLEEPAWQPVRALVERVAASERLDGARDRDQPVYRADVGSLLRREMLLVPASANGDPVTPVIIGNAQREWLWYATGPPSSCASASRTRSSGPTTARCCADWAKQWNPAAEAAAESIAAEIERAPGSRPAVESLAQVKRERDALQSAFTQAEVTA